MKRTARYALRVQNGTVIVAGDGHYWPKLRVPTAHRALVLLTKTLGPDAVIYNGDVLDFPRISKHARIGWENRPKVTDEIATAQLRLQEIEESSPNSELIWTLGNHDERFETMLANKVPEYANVHGIHLKDHFPKWIPAWSVEINRNTIVKHRFKGGVHAAYNNAKDSGRNIVTNHLHALNLSAYTDYNGTRFGVDAGMLADPMGPQFTNYTEDNPLNWRSGFVVLRFRNGRLQFPEFCFVEDERKGLVSFNGDTFAV